MVALSLIPAVLSCLLLAAHFLRDGSTLLTATCVALPVLFLLRERWVPRLIQLLLLVGCLEWLRTLIVLVIERSSAGEPWGRLAAILGIVAMFTAASALGLRGKRASAWFDGAG